MRLLWTVLVLLFMVLPVYAIMPPDVYRKAIADSPIKAIAVVKSVEVVEETEFYIEKKVEFSLIKSYGVVRPDSSFNGCCKSATDNPIVGGTIYYYPEVGEKVFVTLDGVGKAGEDGCITSYTPMTVELETILDGVGLEGLEYGIGEVYPRP